MLVVPLPASWAATGTAPTSGDLQEHAHEYARRTGLLAEDEFFHPEQSSRTVKAAEQY